MFVNKNNISESATFNTDNIYQNLLLDTSTGIIYDTEQDFKLICNNQPKFKKINNFDEIPKEFNCKVEYCEDGTVIRLYYYRGWRTATNNCSNALFSKWGKNETFDSMFWELFDITDCENLDKNMTYIFVLKYKTLQNIIEHNKSELVYVCKMSNELQLDSKNSAIDSTFNINFERVSEFKNLKNPRKIDINVMKNNDLELMYNRFKRGILFYCFDDDNVLRSIYQYDFKYFQKINKIKNNNPNLINRFIEIYTTYLFQLNSLQNQPITAESPTTNSPPQPTTTNSSTTHTDSSTDSPIELRELFENTKMDLYLYERHYRNYQNTFRKIKNNIRTMISQVYKLYVSSHIRQQEKIDDTCKYYKTIKSIHYLYKNGTKINYSVVLQYITQLPVNIIKKLI